MAITPGIEHKDGTGLTLNVGPVPAPSYISAASTTSSHTGNVRWGEFKRTNFTYDNTTGYLTSVGAFKYYSWILGDTITWMHSSVSGGAEQGPTDIVAQIDDDTIQIASGLAAGNLTDVTVFQGVIPQIDLVYVWSTPGAAGYVNTDPRPLLTSNVIDPTRWLCHTIPCHIEAAGAYNWTCTIYDYANSDTAGVTVAVTATVGSWTTKYLDPAGNDTNTGDAPGAAAAWQTWKKGYDWAVGAANRKVSVAGGVYPDMTAAVATHGTVTGPALIVWDGTSTQPAVECKTFIASYGTGQLNGMRIVGIKFTKDGVGTQSYIFKYLHADSLILRCAFESAAAGVTLLHGAGTVGTPRNAIADCIFVSRGLTSEATNIYSQSGDTEAKRMGGLNLVACRFLKTRNDGEVLRFGGNRFVHAYNDFRIDSLGTISTGTHWKWDADVTDHSAVVWHNSFAYDPASLPPTLMNLKLGNNINARLIVDGNSFVSSSPSSGIAASDVRFDNVACRNNVFISSGEVVVGSVAAARSWEIVSNSCYTTTPSNGFRIGDVTLGGVDRVVVANNILSLINLNTGAAVNNWGNSGLPAIGRTIVDHNLFQVTGATTALIRAQTYADYAEVTGATYTESTARVSKSGSGWTIGKTQASGDRAWFLAPKELSAHTEIRQVISVVNDDTIALGAGGWTDQTGTVHCKWQRRSQPTYSQIADWVAAKPNETHNLGGRGASAVDPLFVDAANGDLRLQAGSPAIGSGKVISNNRFDYRGNPRKMTEGALYDMGAIAYNLDSPGLKLAFVRH